MAINWEATFSKLLDPYEVKARLFPGLLVLLPAILFLALLYGAKNPVVVGLSTVLATCGGPYLLSSFVRTWGLRAQDRLVKNWGGLPTTVVLRHRDATLPQPTKLRYHELVATRLGVTLPSAVEEQRDPEKADQAYAAVIDALRPLTNERKRFALLFKELVSYGFNRNAHGSRWIGVAVAVITTVATLTHAGALNLTHPHWISAGLDDVHIAVLLSSAVLFALWCIHFNADTVRLAGYAYAKRLLEALDHIPKKSLRQIRKSPESVT